MEAHSHVVAAPLEWVLLASASVGTGVTVILRVAVLVLSTGSWQRVPENWEVQMQRASSPVPEQVPLFWHCSSSLLVSQVAASTPRTPHIEVVEVVVALPGLQRIGLPFVPCKPVVVATAASSKAMASPRPRNSMGFSPLGFFCPWTAAVVLPVTDTRILIGRVRCFFPFLIPRVEICYFPSFTTHKTETAKGAGKNLVGKIQFFPRDISVM